MNIKEAGKSVFNSEMRSFFVFLPTFTCLMLHKRHLNVFLTRLRRSDFQQLTNDID